MVGYIYIRPLFFLISPKSMWINFPISVLIALVLRMLMTQVEFHWKAAVEDSIDKIVQDFALDLWVKEVNLVDLLTRYINELVEYLFLSGNDIFSRIEAGDQSSKEHRGHSLHAGNAQNVESSRGEHDITHNQELESRLAKSGNWREKALTFSETTQRRTEVLAPENLENKWAWGRHYKEKIHSVATVPVASGTKGAPTIFTKESAKGRTINRSGNVGLDNKGIVQLLPGSDCIAQVNHSHNNWTNLPDNLDNPLTLKDGPVIDEVENTTSFMMNGNKSRLKRSNITSALKNLPDDKRANVGESKEPFFPEVSYGPDFRRHSVENRFKGPSDSVIHAEGSVLPNFQCRVIRAYFKRIGSKSFSVYSIAVTDAENDTWFVKRRRRNFERLHQHLKDIPNYKLHLPPRRIFSSSIEDAFVHQQCIQLDKYLQDLLSIANVAEQHEAWDFLSVSSKNYSFRKSSSVMRSLGDNVVDDIVRQFKGVSDGLMRKVVGFSSLYEGSTSMLVRNFPRNADDLRHSSLNSSIETANIVSDNEGDKVEIHGQEVAGSSTQANVWHSDNELNRKDFLPRVGKRNEGYRSLESEKRYISELKSEWKDAGRAAGLPVISGHMEDPVGVPPEWTPPNVCASVLNLVDKIFQLNRRGWIRFYGLMANFLSTGNKVSHPGYFEVQLEAAWRASNVNKIIFNGAPTALVSLIGHKHYSRCARDIYYFFRCSICVKQLAYGVLELLLVAVIPELRNLVLDVHEKILTSILTSANQLAVNCLRSTPTMMVRTITIPPPPSAAPTSRALLQEATDDSVANRFRSPSSKRPLPTITCSSSGLRSNEYIPKREPFSRTKLERAAQDLPLIRKAESEIADYCSVLEGDESYSCWRAYFELKDLQESSPKGEVERLIIEAGGVKSLVGCLHGVAAIHKAKKEGRVAMAKGANAEQERPRIPLHMPDGLPRSADEMEEEEKGRMPDSAYTRLLRLKGRRPAWYSPAPDHETD
ncbi:hypothetical protein Nepgr_004563 [Nepenthes gracilis]|uniref:PX domain-containing protein n=1 Tax=Nepenthes gracilis TaxID=150966 RepID=A0AAD3S1W6_NEPGR|nr:hypothetical protein Nepgr_004563 [Nepenthes gracilis]